MQLFPRCCIDWKARLQELVKQKSDVKITLVVLLGKPLLRRRRHTTNTSRRKTMMKLRSQPRTPRAKPWCSKATTTRMPAISETVEDDETTWNPFRMGVNPRLQAGGELWCPHQPDVDQEAYLKL
jgi:hypothetical protein